MNRNELVASIAERVGMKKTDVSKVLDGFMDEVQGQVAAGEKVALVGFGSFERSFVKARQGRNMATGEAIQIDSAFRPRFSAGSKFKECVRFGLAPTNKG